MAGLEIDSGFWSGKRVFLTGHTGFKGAWLSLWLKSLGAEVLGYSLEPPTEPNLFKEARIPDCLAAHHTADIRDLASLQKALEGARADIVFHMAAQSLVRASYEDPVSTLATNLMGTTHVLEAVRRVASVKAVVVITTDKCYENKEWVHPYRESDPLGGADPYSCSKACAELVTASYRTSFFSLEQGGARIASVRAGNVIGGGDWADQRLIPDCIRAFRRGEAVFLRYPQAVRPWQHVLEPLAGYLMLAERLHGGHGAQFANAWNFGPDPAGETTVHNVACAVARCWGEDAKIRTDPKTATYRESNLLRLDSTKARVELGWTPRWSLNRCLEETVAWYRAWHGGKDMHLFTAQQIKSYSGKAE